MVYYVWIYYIVSLPYNRRKNKRRDKTDILKDTMSNRSLIFCPGSKSNTIYCQTRVCDYLTRVCDWIMLVAGLLTVVFVVHAISGVVRADVDPGCIITACSCG